MRIIKCAASIGKNLGFDHYEAETLCDQIQKYINEQEPFDLDIGFAKDNPVIWWKYINTEPEPDVLPRIASYLFAICPNSATCEPAPTKTIEERDYISSRTVEKRDEKPICPTVTPPGEPSCGIGH
ncbi:hypothetical protein GLOIN_2v1783329 [Rhizophagus irregularis DAOM 181602=DAOM 197198]|uniref:HAT C-terminal dimerisation domain-containing protein n=1 Tax=Rhizophagus irregularis (strain DAOM 181602 / DAOM 197198 / MUCL 43194) TaxID=747089 RepID=A0A2P4PFB6_RHIID|nr:hypothetical protein GLOIN_2v1783329 [Rhizophagus irregularis DAOM 181602=DAOM 197198]POG64071.1 hypothetical protein GLOIN_2v1783329 [Rhizophagus irregularis DAOM 181602=DAOM 197198]|eukprot:XP_025170937.1 hypothetical protein GLOIN_2v1783329 [Rhizophagus irregularis DAOM 181602=DAOM 197198]